MTLQETKDIITVWINSCTTSEQLDLLTEVIKRFVVDRFTGQVDMMDMVMAETDLNEALSNQKLIVASLQNKTP